MKKYAIMFLIGLSISLPARASYHENLSQMNSFQAWARPQKTSHQNGAISRYISVPSDPRPVRAPTPPSFPYPLCSAQSFSASQIMELSFCLPKGPWLPGSNDLRGYFVTTRV